MEAFRAHHRDPHGKPLLSVVVPVFNEEQIIRLTHSRIVEVLGGLEDFDLEVVYVDDGSKDRSSAMLSDIAQSDSRVCVASLSRNFGHQQALTAGLRQASGDIVSVIDADLQDPVELILEMLTKWREGYAVVYGVRRNRQESTQRVLAYRIFYRLLSWLSDIDIPRDSGDFCLLDRRVVDAINRLPEKNRFVRGLRAWWGGRQIGVPYDRPARAAGQSGYSIAKMLNLAFDGIVSFSLLPLRLIFYLGLGSFIFAMLSLLFFLAHRIFAFEIFGSTPADVPGFTSLILVGLLLGGVQLLSIGVLGEYLGRIYLEVKDRPEYVLSHLHPSLYAQPTTEETWQSSARLRS
jgi:dolichol-phosphate mannosyltransferase